MSSRRQDRVSLFYPSRAGLLREHCGLSPPAGTAIHAPLKRSRYIVQPSRRALVKLKNQWRCARCVCRISVQQINGLSHAGFRQAELVHLIHRRSRSKQCRLKSRCWDVLQSGTAPGKSRKSLGVDKCRRDQVTISRVLYCGKEPSKKTCDGEICSRKSCSAVHTCLQLRI